MNRAEIKALRRPFLKELFRKNKLNLFMTVLAAVLGSVAELVVSRLIKEIADLIAGESRYAYWTLLIIACAAFGLFALKNGVIAEHGTFNEPMEEKGCFYSLFTVSQQ